MISEYENRTFLLFIFRRFFIKKFLVVNLDLKVKRSLHVFTALVEDSHKELRLITTAQPFIVCREDSF